MGTGFSATLTQTTYLTTGAREDLVDMISNISPVETFFTSATGNVDAKQRYHEFQTDALDTPAANAVSEGSDFTATAVTATTRLGNFTQCLRKSFSISDTTEATSMAGRKSEIAYQTQKALKALANDIEYALVINAAAASASAGSARTMKGVIGFITTNTASGASAASTVETTFNTALALLWAAGGKPSTVVVGGVLKRVISGFTGNNTRFNTMTDAGKVQASVDVYNSDFGAVKVIPHYILHGAAPTKSIIFGDMGLWRKAWLRKPKTEELARVGSARNYMIETELTLEGLNEKGSAMITTAL
jgi:hypothetical protein